MGQLKASPQSTEQIHQQNELSELHRGTFIRRPTRNVLYQRPLVHLLGSWLSQYPLPLLWIAVVTGLTIQQDTTVIPMLDITTIVTHILDGQGKMIVCNI